MDPDTAWGMGTGADDSEVGAGSDACDHIGGNTFPLPVVLLTQGTKLETPAGQCVVLASAGLPYLPPGDDREGVPCSCTGNEQLPASLLPVFPAW